MLVLHRDYIGLVLVQGAMPMNLSQVSLGGYIPGNVPQEVHISVREVTHLGSGSGMSIENYMIVALHKSLNKVMRNH